MTFKEIQDDAMDRLNLTSTEARARVKRTINEWYRRILSRLGMNRPRDGEVTVSTSQGTAEYTVTASKITMARNEANKVVLVERSIAWLRDMDPDNSQAGEPVAYIIRKTGATTFTVRFWPTPDATGSIKLDVTTNITDLSGDSDVPAFPADYHWLLSLGARVAEYEKLDDDRLKDARQDLEQGIRELRYFIRKSHTNTNPPGNTTVSRLGQAYEE